MSASPHTGAGAGAKPLRVDDVLYEAALSERLPNLQAENAAMLELVRALATAPGSVVQRLVETACALTGAGSAGLSVIDRENGEDVFRWVATTGEYARYVSGTMPRDFSPCGEVLHRGTPLLMRDLRRIYPYVDAMHAPPANALLVPFAEDGRLVGTIWVLHHDAEADFDSEDLRIVSSLSVFASAVNATVGLVRQLQEQQARQAHDLEFHERELRDTRRLHTVAAQLIGADGGSAIYNDILNAAIEIVDADAGTIQLLDPRTQTLSLLATRGFGAEMRAHFEQVDAMSGSPCGRALAAGRREFVVFDPELADPDGATRRHLEAGLVCAQSTPLVSRSGRAVGMCSTHWRTRRVLTDRELRFLDLLGRQAADLIERSQVHAALQASEQSLRDQARRKDEFIAMLAHELRNPLAPIRTGIALLKHAQEPLVTQVRPMMERQVVHMVRLVDDLLDVSRITSGRVQLKREMVTVGSLIDSAVESQQPALEAGGIVLCRALDDPGQQVHVDPARLSQVVANILHNAVKFTPAGGRITVRTAVERGERAGAPAVQLIQVEDTGVGIPRDMLDSIFDLFTQIRPDSSARQGGMGIGLALSRTLIELHGGSITAESAGPGQGSCFSVRIPLPATPASPGALAAPPAEAPAARPVGISVLVVDDNRDAADSMALLLQQRGCEVRVAYGALAGLELLQHFQPALVLLDIGMPEVDGYEACRRIRLAHGDGVFVAALTGWGQDSDRSLTAAAGFDTHLTKPVDLERVEKVIAQALQRKAPSADGEP
jgi:signal transduction histidine kinase/ActR/RegA family two-component response regulator